jgi:hypothetical protein
MGLIVLALLAITIQAIDRRRHSRRADALDVIISPVPEQKG